MADTMRVVRFHEFGEPGDVLRLGSAPVPEPPADRVRVAVEACGIAPADWALCRGLFPGSLPRGIGCDVAGVVTAVGTDVTGTEVGDRVFGTTDWAHSSSAGAADEAIMDRWFPRPDGLDPIQAAALPMTVDTANGHLHWLRIEAGQSIVINGAGGTIGFAATQIALLRGLRVVATAGSTYAAHLERLGAQVTTYGEGMAERVMELNGGPFDLALDTAPVGGALPDLVTSVGGDPRRVLTVSDFDAAKELGVRHTFAEDLTDKQEVLPEFAQLAAEGRFTVPVARTFGLDQWREALEVSQSAKARGKLLFVPTPA